VTSPNAPDKKTIAEFILGRSPLYVHFDPRRTGVIAPAHLCHDAHLTLQFGYNMPIAIPDMAVNDDGIEGTLSFGSTCGMYYCAVPWGAVFTLADVDYQGISWPDSMPADLGGSKVVPLPSRGPTSKPAIVRGKRIPYLRVVK
jgi:hypothetical protein